MEYYKCFYVFYLICQFTIEAPGPRNSITSCNTPVKSIEKFLGISPVLNSNSLIKRPSPMNLIVKLFPALSSLGP